jgi:hypothetical protein
MNRCKKIARQWYLNSFPEPELTKAESPMLAHSGKDADASDLKALSRGLIFGTICIIAASSLFWYLVYILLTTP